MGDRLETGQGVANRQRLSQVWVGPTSVGPKIKDPKGLEADSSRAPTASRRSDRGDTPSLVELPEECCRVLSYGRFTGDCSLPIGASAQPVTVRPRASVPTTLKIKGRLPSRGYGQAIGRDVS